MEKRELYKLSQRLAHIERDIANMKELLGQYFSPAEQTVLNYEASVGRENTIIGTMSPDKLEEYAQSCEDYLRFGREIEACMEGKLDRYTAVWLGRIPDILVDVGCTRDDMYVTQKHLNSIMRDSVNDKSHSHSIDKRMLKQLPELLEHPLAIVAAGQDTITAVLDIQDRNHNQVIVPIRKKGQAFYDEKRQNANFILSTYGKRHIDRYLVKAAQEERVLYLDKKISTILEVVPLQLRQVLDGTYKKSIPQNVRKVNEISRKNTDIKL